MSKCRYDRETGDYLADGEPCKRDDYGDPTFHCTARRSCAQHVGPNDLTCLRCLSRARTNLERIPELAALMLTVAIGEGVNSEAAVLAGPAADPEAWEWRKIAARQGRAWHVSLIEEDDEHHPYLVLGRWDLMIREDYNHPSDEPVSVTNAADYLGRMLHRIAQDPEQDFGLLADELRTCRQHLDSVLHTAARPQRGAPCPDCTSEETGVGPRLVLHHGHWCDDEDCEKIHYADEAGDRWQCPRDPDHWRDPESYRNYIQERNPKRRAEYA